MCTLNFPPKGNRNKYRPNERVFLREESFESGSSRTQSSESGGSVPQIFVNYW